MDTRVWRDPLNHAHLRATWNSEYTCGNVAWACGHGHGHGHGY